MSNAQEATNDFCTRCFKYNRCTKVQSECTMADSYQEGYGDGYHQAEKDLELMWEDIETIREMANKYCKLHSCEPRFFVYSEILKQFKDFKERKQQ